MTRNFKRGGRSLRQLVGYAMATLALMTAATVVAANPANAQVDGDDLVRECQNRGPAIIIERFSADRLLCRGDVAFSANGLYGLVMQGDGNLVFYRLTNAFQEDTANAVVWRSSTTTGFLAHMNPNGDFALYSANGNRVGPCCTSRVANSWIKVQNDGKLVQYDSNNRPLTQNCRAGGWCSV